MATVLIVGASSGIGLATAEYLAERGWRVFGTSRYPERAPQTKTEIKWIAMDVTDEESVSNGFKSVLDEISRLDAVVCNAGYSIWGSVEEVTIEKAKEQFDTNFFGTLRVLRAVIPHFRENMHGRIVITGSLAGRAPIPFQAHYSASKAALDNLAQALRMELHPFKVKVSLIEPGDINTPFNDNMEWVDTSNSPYGQRIKNCEQVVRESLPKAPGPEVIAKTIAKALSARFPRMRYPAGPDSILVPLGRRFFPDWLALWLIRDHFKI